MTRFAEDNERWTGKADKAIDKYYPDRPEHSIPPSLPLEAYTGTYFHPGYLNFTLELAEPGKTKRAGAALAAKRPDATWPTYNEFVHVSGEYWMLYLYTLDAPAGVANKEYAPAQFRVGPGGKADALGITFISVEPSQDTVEGLIWFERIE